MIYYRCYDAHAEDRRWAKTDSRWRIAFSKDKHRVSKTDDFCDGLMMRDETSFRSFFYLYASLKPIRKQDLPSVCQENLDKFIEDYQTEEVL